MFSIEKDHTPQDYLTISAKSNIQSENTISYFSLGLVKIQILVPNPIQNM